MDKRVPDQKKGIDNIMILTTGVPKDSYNVIFLT